ncbi:MAG: nitroreductase [Clostridia bacterium]|nr:nitroreductase [Clostridia bacterium]
MNEVINSIIKRRSVKKFKDEMIPRETLEKILVAGTYAPTGMNRQSPIMVCITNKEIRDRLSKLNASIMGRDGIDPFYGAPVVVIVLADTSVRTYKYDGSLVMGNLMLAADSLGIGSCWIHRAKEEFETEEGKQILKDLGIEGEYEGIGNCILGYIDGDYPEVRPRKDGYVYFVE